MSRGGAATKQLGAALRGYSSEVTAADLLRLSDAAKVLVAYIDDDGLIIPSVTLNGTTPPTGQSIVRRGTTPPASPVDGDLFWDTTDKCLYAYDVGRTKWLSVEVYEYGFGRASGETTGVYLRPPNAGVGSATYGYYLNHDMTIVGWSLSCGTSGTYTIQSREDGSNITGGSISIVAAANANAENTDADTDADTVFCLFNDVLGAIPGKYNIRVYMRRRTS